MKLEILLQLTVYTHKYIATFNKYVHYFYKYIFLSRRYAKLNGDILHIVNALSVMN